MKRERAFRARAWSTAAVAIAVGCVLSLASARSAHAQSVLDPAPLPPAPETDPLLPTGITLSALSAAGLLAGAGMIGASHADDSSDGHQYCDEHGCSSASARSLKAGGIAMMAGSAALAAVSVPVWGSAASGEPQRRYSDAMATTGVVLTSTGLAATTASLAASAYGASDLGEATGVMMPYGLLAMAVGIPLWVAGDADAEEPARVRPPEEQSQRGEQRGPQGSRRDGLATAEPNDRLPEGVWVDHDRTMKHWGMGLTIGGCTLIAGGGIAMGAMFADQDPDEDMGGLAALVVGVPIMSTGLLLTAAGIPLWAVGASDELVSPDDPRAIEKRQEESQSLMPEVQIGLGSGSLKWTF